MFYFFQTKLTYLCRILQFQLDNISIRTPSPMILNAGKKELSDLVPVIDLETVDEVRRKAVETKLNSSVSLYLK